MVRRLHIHIIPQLNVSSFQVGRFSVGVNSDVNLSANWQPPEITPYGFWNRKSNQLNYMNWMSSKLNIKSMEDWYKISANVIQYFTNFELIFIVLGN